MSKHLVAKMPTAISYCREGMILIDEEICDWMKNGKCIYGGLPSECTVESYTRVAMKGKKK